MGLLDPRYMNPALNAQLVAAQQGIQRASANPYDLAGMSTANQALQQAGQQVRDFANNRIAADRTQARVNPYFAPKPAPRPMPMQPPAQQLPQSWTQPAVQPQMRDAAPMRSTAPAFASAAPKRAINPNNTLDYAPLTPAGTPSATRLR